MSESGLEKQHQATSKRLDELRRKGQTLRSRDLTSGFSLAAAIGIVMYMGNYIADRFENNFVSCFLSIKTVMFSDELPRNFLMKLALDNFILLLPIFLVAIISSILSVFLFGGWNFTFETIQFNFSKMNPINNLKNLFSVNMLVNVAKSLIKVVIILSVLVTFCYQKLDVISGLIHLPFNHSIPLVHQLIQNFIFVVLISLTFVILYDILHQYFQFQNKTKMTTQEIKDEHKDAEGNTDVKRKMKSVQFALLKQRLNILVPRANVIITNPTHYAIAIKYDPGKDHAPKVIAKGKGYIAHQIRQIATLNGISVYEAPVLARAIYHTTKLGMEINPGLYMSVAIVLSYVNQLKRYQMGHAQRPMFIADLKVPEEFIYHE